MRLIPRKQEGLAQELGVPWRFRNEMDRVFNRFFSTPWSDWDEVLTSTGGWRPEIEVSENDQEITVRAELPGMDPKDVDIQISGDTLTITGEKKEESEEKRKGFYHSECRYGLFRRDIVLPTGADPSKITADYDKGVLRVRIAKDKMASPRRIPVAGGMPKDPEKKPSGT